MANRFYEEGLDPDQLHVTMSELLVATSDDADDLIDQNIPLILNSLRRQMEMDFVFVSEFVDGQRVIRKVDAANDSGEVQVNVGDVAPLESTYCKRIVDKRLPELIPNVAKLPDQSQVPYTPFPVGSLISTPIILKDGSVYGTLCCFSKNSNEELGELDLMNLQLAARLTARRLDKTGSEAKR